MGGKLVHKQFTLGNTSFDCWVIKIGNKFWFKAHDIVAFLGYQKPDQAIRKNTPPEARKQWNELRPPLPEEAFQLATSYDSLGYQKPNVPLEAQKQWGELELPAPEGAFLPSN